jgi:type IV secretory pathway VirB6-like protein
MCQKGKISCTIITYNEFHKSRLTNICNIDALFKSSEGRTDSFIRWCERMDNRSHLESRNIKYYQGLIMLCQSLLIIIIIIIIIIIVVVVVVVIISCISTCLLTI